jgi:hypothetical protein
MEWLENNHLSEDPGFDSPMDVQPSSDPSNSNPNAVDQVLNQ